MRTPGSPRHRHTGARGLVAVLLGLGLVALPVIGSEAGPRPVPRGTVGDRVWSDLDQDGLQDPGEPGVPGVRVELRLLVWTVARTTTDAGGGYRFDRVPRGLYSVRFVAPAGAGFTAADVGRDDARDSDARQRGRLAGWTHVFWLLGRDDTSRDAGLLPTTPPAPGSVSGRAWHDTDGDGVRDAAEPALPGVIATLVQAGTGIATATTGADGGYRFDDVAPNDYRVRIAVPEGYALTGVDQGGDDSRDSDIDPATALGPVTTVTSGAVVGGGDVGAWSPARVGGRVWYDGDRDGVQDAGEPGVLGVQVTVDGPTSAPPAVTGAEGRWTVGGLAPGEHDITVAAPAGHEFTAADQGGDDALDSDVSATGATSVVLSSGDVRTDLGAGLVEPPPAPSRIGGSVWFDSDGDGTRDAGEVGVPGVVVRVAAGGSTVARVTTSVAGDYEVAGEPIVPGEHTVTVVPPAQRAFADGPDSDIDPFDGTATVAVPAGGTVTVDAGLVAAELDWGDAPDGYGTSAAQDGPRHVLTGPAFGIEPDAESDGQPSADLYDDDRTDEYDEGDVPASSPGAPGEAIDFAFAATSGGFVDAWVDFDRDGSFEATEQVAAATAVTEGQNTIGVAVPSDVSAGPVATRWRISSRGRLGPTGFAGDGEVEDNQWGIETGLDFGDAPDSYGTSLAQDGARHVWSPFLSLGYDTDTEPDAQVSSDATGDDTHGSDDEDGVGVTGTALPGSTLRVTLTVIGADGPPAYANAWVDWDGSGSFDPGEQVIDDAVLERPMGEGTEWPFDIEVPDDAVDSGAYMLRVRISVGQGLGPTGHGGIGEVEDQLVRVSSSGTVTGRVWADADNDGVQDPGEGGKGGVMVHAMTGDVLHGSVTTATDGGYTLTLPPGNYAIRIGVPGSTFYSPAGVGDEAFDSDIDPLTGVSPTFTLAGGDTVRIDAGLPNPTYLLGAVWLDANGNGVRDTGEAGAGSVGVFHDANDNGTWETGERGTVSSSTGSVGSFVLALPPAGTFLVRVVLPDPTWVVTAPSDGYDLTTATTGGVFRADFGIGPVV